MVFVVLRRIYPDELAKHNYSTTLSSLAFAGTIVGMVGTLLAHLSVLIPPPHQLSFGYLSDKVGRKFGMVSLITNTSTSPYASLEDVGHRNRCRILFPFGVLLWGPRKYWRHVGYA